MVHGSTGGGTGSGVGSLLQERLSVEYGTSKINVGIKLFSSPTFGYNVVEPLNNVLAFQGIFEQEDFTLAFDNQALYDICTNKLKI